MLTVTFRTITDFDRVVDDMNAVQMTRIDGKGRHMKRLLILAVLTVTGCASNPVNLYSWLDTEAMDYRNMRKQSQVVFYEKGMRCSRLRDDRVKRQEDRGKAYCVNDREYVAGLLPSQQGDPMSVCRVDRFGSGLCF